MTMPGEKIVCAMVFSHLHILSSILAAAVRLSGFQQWICHKLGVFLRTRNGHHHYHHYYHVLKLAMAENNPDMATTAVSSSKLAMAEKDPDMGTTAVTSSLRLKAGYG